MWKRVGLALAAMFALLSAGRSIALASNGVWSSIGPFDGFVNSIAIDPGNSDTVYVGNAAGIFKTIDGGASWSSINPGVYPQVLVVDPRDSQTIFAGTISGILKSVDGGATWRNANAGLGTMPGYQGRPGPYAGVSALTIDPQTDVLYAGTNVGLFKSVDGGASWVGLNAGLPALPTGPGGAVTNLQVYLVTVDPRSPTTIYAGGSDVFYMEGRLACCTNALFKSTNGGASWNTLNVPLTLPPTLPSSPVAIPPISSLVIDPGDPNTLYVTVIGFCDCPLKKSTDGGVTWENAGPTYPNSSAVIGMSRITVDARTPNVFYGQTTAGFMKSTDRGVHWTNANLPTTFSAFRIAAVAGTVYVAALSNPTNVGGLFKSTDAAENWKNLSTGLSTAFVTALAIDPQNPKTIYAGGNGIVKSTDGGSTWMDEKGNFYPLTIVMDPHNPRTLYAGTWDAEIGGPVSVFTSTDSGSTWNAAGSGFPGAGASGQITSLAVDPFNSNVIFAGTDQGLLRSTDGGANWDVLTSVPGRFIPSVVFDPQTSGTLYVSGSGGVWKSVDGGANWELPGTGSPSNAVLAIDPQNPKTLYAAGSFPKMLIFKTTDGGHNWTATASAGLPSESNLIGGLIINPKNPNILYLATSGALLDSCSIPCSGLNDGVFRSRDGGASWFAVNFGLTTPHVFSLSIDSQNTDRLYAGTLGGGVFSITFAPTPIVSGLQFDRTSVIAGTSYAANLSGQNLDSETFFDVQFTAPDGSSGIALNWQRGAVASHDATTGTALGSWMITGVRPHEFDADHSGGFFAVSATITVGR